ncbi:MAG TPA: acetate/propionate family kinase [Pseudomonadales bacterium]
MHILVINCGSSSIKYQLIDSVSEQALQQGIIDSIQAEQVGPALQSIFAACNPWPIDAIGHRVVHGGDFRDAQIITDDVLARIGAFSDLAPLHNPYNLQGIQAARELYGTLPQVAVFDTAFHASLPRRAATYAIDRQLAQQHQFRRYGFHGTSHAYVSQQAADFLQQPLSALRIVSLHLGNGASACAVEFGHSTDTSMGMTPMEGLVMGSRCGDIDPGIVLAMARRAGLSIDEIDEQLNRNAGLKGLSGISNDLRAIEQAAADGNDNARLAIAVFAHQVRKYIGAYAATMGGVDAIVMTGGIGENSASMRQRILQRLDFLGALLDDDRNLDVTLDQHSPVQAIHRPHSRVKLLVVQCNEALQIARQTAAIVQQANTLSAPAVIPVAISARHVHLTAATFARLFGADAQPEHYRDLSQPGQFACRQTVKLIGPRGQIDQVRVLGPLRSKDQVEISRTDEFQLGVDAPVRDSGHTEGSAPITLQGPAGTVHLAEGLICARRHIHMHPDDAAAFAVSDGDEVDVAITGGVRKLVFGGVLIRVHPSFRLEMHIDTDEANAAELDGHSNARLVYQATPAGAVLQSRR